MSSLTSERLLKLLQKLQAAGRPVSVGELLQAGGLRPGAQGQLLQKLRELVRGGAVKQEGKRFQSAAAPPKSKLTPYDERPRAPAAKLAPPPKVAAREPKRPERSPAPAQKRRQSSPARPPASYKESPKGNTPATFKESPRGTRQGPGAGAGAGAAIVEGTLHVHRDGFGFVHPIGSTTGENIYLAAHEARRALDNDRVEVEVVPSRGGRTEGRLIRVVDRKRSQAIGIYEENGRQARVLPRDRGLGPIRVPPTQMARPGDVVKVRLGAGRGLLTPGEGLTGEVSGSLGASGEPSQEVLSSAYAEGFQDEFPPEAMDEADAVHLTVSEAEARGEGRRDLRSLPLVTIDGEDARDFDDAVHARAEGSGWRLWVAIADVTHYVRPGSALDDEAFRRATSVYLPDRVLPMLPERLSNGICSLRPDEDRLCMVAEMLFDRQAKLLSYELYPGVMRSAARCTYAEVQAVLDGHNVSHRNAFRPHVQTLWALAQALHAMRKRRGAIDFDLPETKVALSEEGLPLRMERRERQNSHRLIEECMLAANEAVAQHFIERKLPSVFRHHGEPDEDKLALFSALAGVYGFHLPKGDEVSPRALNRLLEQMESHPERRALNQLLLRSMMQAAYSAVEVGHYGLGADHYLHFTSPIRRYPDLLVHRLLKADWARHGRRPAREMEAETAKLQTMAEHCSDRERAAMRVERDISAYYATLFMADRVGEEFEATVSSLAEFGFFVELDELFVEGRVRGESLGRGFRFDAGIHALVYPSGRKVRVGQRLRVRLTSANVERRQMEFEALAFEGEVELKREPEREREGGRQRRFEPGRPRADREKERGKERENGAASGSPHPGFDRLRAQGREPSSKRNESKPSGKASGRSKRSGKKSRRR